MATIAFLYEFAKFLAGLFKNNEDAVRGEILERIPFVDDSRIWV
jgi:hypothetical protein